MMRYTPEQILFTLDLLVKEVKPAQIAEAFLRRFDPDGSRGLEFGPKQVKYIKQGYGKHPDYGYPFLTQRDIDRCNAEKAERAEKAKMAAEEAAAKKAEQEKKDAADVAGPSTVTPTGGTPMLPLASASGVATHPTSFSASAPSRSLATPAHRYRRLMPSPGTPGLATNFGVPGGHENPSALVTRATVAPGYNSIPRHSLGGHPSDLGRPSQTNWHRGHPGCSLNIEHFHDESGGVVIRSHRDLERTLAATPAGTRMALRRGMRAGTIAAAPATVAPATAAPAAIAPAAIAPNFSPPIPVTIAASAASGTTLSAPAIPGLDFTGFQFSEPVASLDSNPQFLEALMDLDLVPPATSGPGAGDLSSSASGPGTGPGDDYTSVAAPPGPRPFGPIDSDDEADLMRFASTSGPARTSLDAPSVLEED